MSINIPRPRYRRTQEQAAAVFKEIHMHLQDCCLGCGHDPKAATGGLQQHLDAARHTATAIRYTKPNSRCSFTVACPQCGLDKLFSVLVP
jgi:hypothetical protein